MSTYNRDPLQPTASLDFRSRTRTRWVDTKRIPTFVCIVKDERCILHEEKFSGQGLHFLRHMNWIVQSRSSPYGLPLSLRESGPLFLYKFPPSFYKKPWLTTERRASFYLGGDGTGVIHVYWHQLLMSCFHLLHPL